MYNDVDDIRMHLIGKTACEGCSIPFHSIPIEDQLKLAEAFNHIEAHVNHTKRCIERESPGVTLVMAVKGVPETEKEITVSVLVAAKMLEAFKWKGSR